MFGLLLILAVALSLPIADAHLGRSHVGLPRRAGADRARTPGEGERRAHGGAAPGAPAGRDASAGDPRPSPRRIR